MEVFGIYGKFFEEKSWSGVYYNEEYNGLRLLVYLLPLQNLIF
jgi:hypothetical protein